MENMKKIAIDNILMLSLTLFSFCLSAQVAPDEDTNPDLTCPTSGIYQNDDTRVVDIPGADNVGIVDDRSCYSDYSESTVYGETWGVYNITHNSNHWDSPGTLQPRIERSLSRSTETGVGSYARFTGTLRILEVGDTTGDNNDGSYLMQTKGKHTGGGGPSDPAICLYLAMPVYGDDGNGNIVQVSFDIVREQINFRGGSGVAGRQIVFLRNVLKDEIIEIELEVGFREDPNDPDLKVHYSDAVIGGEVFNWNIPEPEKGLESGIRYGAYRVKGGRAQMRWEGGPGGPYVVVSTLKAPPATDTDKTWTVHYDVTNDTYRFESRSEGRFLYQNADGTVTHSPVPETDNRSVWQATPSDMLSSLDIVEPNFGTLLYPNPVKQNGYLSIESESQHGYQIFNLHGMLVKSGTEKTVQIDLERGIYFLTQNNSSKTERFIVY